MDVKTYEAFDLKDAVASVKKDLGPNAVIISTREIPATANQKKTYEVRAASSVDEKKFGATVGKGNTSPDRYQAQIQKMSESIEDLKSSFAQKNQVFQIQNNVNEIKTLLFNFVAQKNISNKDVPAYLQDIELKAEMAGISADIIYDLRKFLKTHPEPHQLPAQYHDQPSQYYSYEAMRWMMRKLRLAPDWLQDREGTQMHVFLGSSGVGKTSVVSKIAASFKKDHRKNCNVMSLERNRVGAFESLKFISKIYDIPFSPVSNLDEIKKVLNSNCDFSFIDTDVLSGNIPDEEKSFLRNLRKASPRVKFHLVLSLSERTDQIEQSIRRASQFGIDSLIFTKLDEACIFGDIFNISYRWSLPISYFSTGIQIPEDFERASRERVVERIFSL